ncbi:winged helix-turn-helix transcriptional regulator [Brevibacillus sp. NPDC003440]|uniref:winged helix-turn-helix transcriptional regulator n=1 Tax=Brevibacillus sp. NPDC003440 TaxID=3363951 RepID=UPI0036B3E466
MQRIVYHQVPLKVEYSLTEEGESLQTILNLMCAYPKIKWHEYKNSPSNPHWEIDGEQYHLLTSLVFFSVLLVVYYFNHT